MELLFEQFVHSERKEQERAKKLKQISMLSKLVNSVQIVYC